MEGMLRLQMTASKNHKLSHHEHMQFLMLDDVIDRINVMRKQERTTYHCKDYLRKTTRSNEQLRTTLNKNEKVKFDGIDEFCREQLVEWAYRVVDYFNINREVVSIAITYLDRLLSLSDCDRRTFKLAATASLYLAIKLNESTKIDILSILCDLSRGEFSLSDIIEMEKLLLEALSWNLHPPTASCFIGHMLTLLPKAGTRSFVHSLSAIAVFFTELSVCDYYFTTQYPSTVAMASILNAIEILNFNDYMIPFQESFLDRIAVITNLHRESKEVLEARRQLWIVYERSEESILLKERDCMLRQTLKNRNESNPKTSSRKHQSPVCVSRK